MKKIPDFVEKIFQMADNYSFNDITLQIFRLHLSENPVYGDFVKNIGISSDGINNPGEIPFLPVDFFKTQKIIMAEYETDFCFESTGTTGSKTSKHFIADTGIYSKSVTLGFRRFYGPPSDYLIFALVPERKNSSLVYMLDLLIRNSGRPESGFYYERQDELNQELIAAEAAGRPAILAGLSYALLDFGEKFNTRLNRTIIMETGGMKGKRKEMTRNELHDRMRDYFGVKTIHSEYGMCELLSQAYSNGAGRFNTPPWMKIFIREVNDPFSLCEPGKTGLINIVDLANIYSCPFIATDDIGKLHDDGSFEVLGRAQGSEVRGCNLMAEM